MSYNKSQYLNEVWNKVLDYMLANAFLEPQIIQNFYQTSELYELTEEKAFILAPNSIYKQIIQSQSEMLSSCFNDVLNQNGHFVIEVFTKNELPERAEKISTEEVIDYDETDFQSMIIQKDRTFENFVVGDCNRESHAAALACALNPGKFFNPLFIYGNSGLGKTHLLMAIGNYVLKNDPTKKVYYTESLKFVETVVNAIKDNKIDAFKRFMYSIDLLLVDDIQFLAGKEKSHEVFFTIFNELVNNKKQVCLASDRQPKEIKGLEDRLISRFSGGLSVGIDSPEFETSLAILQMKIKQNGYGIDEVEE